MRTVTRPPTAENANWPSDTWPAQPLRIVSEHAGDGEDHDARPEERLRCPRDEHRDEREHQENSKHPDARQLPHRPHAAHALGHRFDATGELPRRLGVGRDPGPRREREDDDERREEDPECEGVGVDAGHVLLEDDLDDPERDPHRDREPEDPHASDHGDEQRLHEERVSERELARSRWRRPAASRTAPPRAR